MSNLRELKKSRTRSAVLKAAVQLFTERGFEDTTMEDVAARSEVAVGTLYNYFKSKNLLLLAVTEVFTQQMLSRGAELIAHPHPDPAQAVSDLLISYCSLFEAFDKQIMRDLTAAGLSTAREVMPEMMQLDALVASQLSELAAALQARGDIDPSLPLREVTMALYGAYATPAMLFITNDALTLTELHAMISAQSRLLFTGLRPRSKR